MRLMDEDRYTILEFFFDSNEEELNDLQIITNDPSECDNGIWPGIKKLIWSREADPEVFSAYLGRFPNLTTLIFNRKIVGFIESTTCPSERAGRRWQEPSTTCPSERAGRRWQEPSTTCPEITDLYLYKIDQFDDYSIFTIPTISFIMGYNCRQIDFEKLFSVTSRPGLEIDFTIDDGVADDIHWPEAITGWKGDAFECINYVLPRSLTLSDCPFMKVFKLFIRSPATEVNLTLEGGLSSLNNLHVTGIASIRGLENCTSLTILGMPYGSFQSIHDLSSLINLKELNLRNTNIDSLHGLEWLDNLETCRVSYTPFMDRLEDYAQNREIDSIKGELCMLKPSLISEVLKESRRCTRRYRHLISILSELTEEK